MNVEQIRNDFPIFNNRPDMTYLDNAATTQKPQAVINALIYFYEHDNFNVHRSVYTPAHETTEQYEAVRQRVAKFINSRHSNSIIFTRGTTDGINTVATGYLRHLLSPGDEIVVSMMEHHSNLLPWMRIAHEAGAKLKYIQLTANGQIDLNSAKAIINDRTKFVALTGVSNVLGTITPVKKVIQLAHQAGAWLLLDAAQMAPEVPINVQQLYPDFMVFSGHKMMGPTGTGVLYVAPKLLDKMFPYQLGGEMIQNVTMHNYSYADVPQRFEAGTPNVAGVIGLGRAIDYLDRLSMTWVQKRCASLGQYLYGHLSKLPDVTVYGPKHRQTGIVAFNVVGIHPHDIATALDIHQIYVRAGQHCAQPLVNECLKTSATLRASLYVYNTRTECDRLVNVIRKVVKFFHAAQRSLPKHHRG